MDRNLRRGPQATDAEGLQLGDLSPGARIGEYTIERRLSSRGTGHRYEAIHRVLPRRVTIKILPAAQKWNQEIALELLREAYIVDALDHPGVPRVYECGMLDDHRPWTATELVDGVSIATLVERSSVSALQVAAIVRDVAEILDHAHRRGLVHHHVTPEAIVFPEIVRRFPLVLADWGGARAHDSTTPLPMMPGSLLLQYRAPEQIHGEVVDGRADVYALGVIARELLAHACPGTAPPVFAALVARMVKVDAFERPVASEVHDHAMWLADQIEPEHAIPELIEDDRTEPMSAASRVITSELSPNVSGEIQMRR